MSKAVKITLAHISDPASYGNPLGLAYLKTYADSVLGKAIAVEIKEYGIASSLTEPRRAAAAILCDRPSAVGFSCYIWNVTAVISICRELKKISPATRLILGGPDATARGAAVLKDSLADVLVRGEGELTFADLLSRFIAGKPWAGTPGTVSLSDGLISEGPQRPPIENLDIIPSPYLAGLFDGKKYHYMVYETARGCPFKCAYCVWSSGGRVRYYSPERAGREIDWLTKQALPDRGQASDSELFRVFVADQDLLMNGPRGRQIVRRIRTKSDGKYMKWLIESDLRHWNRETAMAVNYEKFLCCLGIQSVDRKVLKNAGRTPLPPADLEKRLELLKRYSPKAEVLFQLMLGLPGDSRKSFMKSLRWGVKTCKRIQPASCRYHMRAGVQVFHTSVFPNTKLEKDAAKFGMEWDREPPYLVKSLKGFGKKDIDRCRKDILDMQESNPGIFGLSRKRVLSMIVWGVHGNMI